MAAGLLTSLAMTFGPGLMNWYLNRDMAETQEGAMQAQELLAAMQSQLMQNRAQVEEPFRASLLNSVGGLIDRPQTSLAPGRMSVVNPFLNLNRARRSPTGEYSFEQALPGAQRQFIGPESFEQVTAPGLGFEQGLLNSLTRATGAGFPPNVRGVEGEGTDSGDLTGGAGAAGEAGLDLINEGAVDIWREGGPLDFSELGELSEEELTRINEQTGGPLLPETMDKIFRERGYVPDPANPGKWIKPGGGGSTEPPPVVDDTVPPAGAGKGNTGKNVKKDSKGRVI